MEIERRQPLRSVPLAAPTRSNLGMALFGGLIKPLF
jgi:hypothetical protein